MKEPTFRDIICTFLATCLLLAFVAAKLAQSAFNPDAKIDTEMFIAIFVGILAIKKAES